MQTQGHIGNCYRFGFNGKENDNEVYGDGNFQDYGMRMYDPRIARFASADPLIVKGGEYPWYSPYQFAGNTPIQAIDLDGLEPEYIIKDGKITKPVMTLMHLLYGYDIGTMKIVKYKKVNSMPSDDYDARALYLVVEYLDPEGVNDEGKKHRTSTYDDINWFELVAHEGDHENGMGVLPSQAIRFMMAYGICHVYYGYDNNPFEEHAFRAGYTHNGVTSLTRQYLQENPATLDVLRSDMTDYQKSLYVSKYYYENQVKLLNNAIQTQQLIYFSMGLSESQTESMLASMRKTISNLNTAIDLINTEIEESNEESSD